MQPKLTDAEVWTAIHALRLAADQYQIDANSFSHQPILARQFEGQAIETRKLADKLEESIN